MLRLQYMCMCVAKCAIKLCGNYLIIQLFCRQSTQLCICFLRCKTNCLLIGKNFLRLIRLPHIFLWSVMNSIFKNILRYKSTIFYMVFIVAVNTLFVYMPLLNIMGSEVSPMDPLVGVVYVLRDFAQREIKHKVIIAMMIGSVLSYYLADKSVAIASVASFVIAEFIDWGIYTFTKKPLSQRILWSALISSPVDSLVFLYLVHQLNWLGWTVLTAAKILGVYLLWYVWRLRERRNIALSTIEIS